MGWENVDNRHKRHIDSNFISCSEKYELSYLKKLIKEEYPLLSEYHIDIAISHCCNDVPAPRERERFLLCLKNRLGVR